MSKETNIKWTESTWNPITGCSKISAGCKNCYALRDWPKLAKKENSVYFGRKFTDVAFHSDRLDQPIRWKKPRKIFVNSMSDLFHEDIPLDYIKMVFGVMNDCRQHQFQVLTKRAKRLAELAPELSWSENIWMGVSVENQRVESRIDFLRSTPAKIKFLSLEPLIGPLPNINLVDIDWVIVGGESGRNPRPIKPEWVMDIKNQCVQAEVPFFFKQWGGVHKSKSGRRLGGRLYNQMPLHSMQFAGAQ